MTLLERPVLGEGWPFLERLAYSRFVPAARPLCSIEPGWVKSPTDSTPPSVKIAAQSSGLAGRGGFAKLTA